MCLGRGAAPRWGLGAPGGGCLIPEVPSPPPFSWLPALFGPLRGWLAGRPEHARELWRKFHSMPGAQRQLLASRLPNPRGASKSGLVASKLGLSHPLWLSPPSFYVAQGSHCRLRTLWSKFVLKEFMEEMPEVTPAQLGSCLGWEFGVS